MPAPATSRRWIPLVVLPLTLALSTSAARSADFATPGAIELPSYGESLTRMLFVLAIVVGVLLLLPKVIPRFIKSLQRSGQPSRSQAAALIQIVESRPMGKGRALSVVRVGRRHFLVTATEQGLTIASGVMLSDEDLARLDVSPDSSSAEQPARRSFLDVLRGTPAV